MPVLVGARALAVLLHFLARDRRAPADHAAVFMAGHDGIRSTRRIKGDGVNSTLQALPLLQHEVAVGIEVADGIPQGGADGQTRAVFGKTDGAHRALEIEETGRLSSRYVPELQAAIFAAGRQPGPIR